MGAALSYARRYALFALVGIAGEDDLDAPDLLTEPSPAIDAPGEIPVLVATRKPRNGSIHQPRQPKPFLAAEPSAAVRDQLIVEIQACKDQDELALWAHRSLPTKNSLASVDAQPVEARFQARLAALGSGQEDNLSETTPTIIEKGVVQSELGAEAPSGPKHHSPERAGVLAKPLRLRDKAHRKFVTSQPCTVCGRTPADAHHLRFAQPRALGCKVSDEFTVPLCRLHHRELHRAGDERLWWKHFKVDPLHTARRLW